MLIEFRHIVDSYNALCDQEIFTKQFNVFFWLFHQQPQASQKFLDWNPKYIQNLKNQFHETLEKSKQNSDLKNSNLPSQNFDATILPIFNNILHKGQINSASVRLNLYQKNNIASK